MTTSTATQWGQTLLFWTWVIGDAFPTTVCLIKLFNGTNFPFYFEI